MNRIFMVAMALALCACATPSELRARGASLSFTSAKDARAVAGCISEKWEDASILAGLNGPTTTKMRSNGYTITAYAQIILVFTRPALIADVDDTISGSKTDYFMNGLITVFGTYYIDAIKDCQ